MFAEPHANHLTIQSERALASKCVTVDATGKDFLFHFSFFSFSCSCIHLLFNLLQLTKFQEMINHETFPFVTGILCCSLNLCNKKAKKLASPPKNYRTRDLQ